MARTLAWRSFRTRHSSHALSVIMFGRVIYLGNKRTESAARRWVNNNLRCEGDWGTVRLSRRKAGLPLRTPGGRG